MKSVALLALVAFIATILPNRVEAAGKCYLCNGDEGELSCEKFKAASADEKKKKFTQDEKTPTDIGQPDCTKCARRTKNGKVIGRGCGQKGVDICEGDFCNGPSGSAKSTGKCHACDEEGFGTCEEFDSASADEKKTKFMMDSKTSPGGFDCKKCATVKNDGKVILRTCADSGLDVCKGDLCNGAGSLKSWTAVALLATVVSFLKGAFF